MHVRYSLLASQATTAIFVLLWGSAAIFTRWGLDNASPMALLVFRFLIALVALAPLAIVRRRWLPAPGTRLQTAATGLMLIGGYSVCYFEAMANGVTPGLIATIMGIQPILTLCVVERRLQGRRLLVLLVWRSLAASPMAMAGILFALAALLLMTFGALWQKRSRQSPADVLPLQYAVSLGLCLLIAPVSGFRFTVNVGLIIPVLFLGLLISVVAQLLLYRLLSAGNIVNVTSLFYLVPAITALLDYLLLGNRLPAAAMVGMVAIVGGIVLVFRTGKVRAG
ncbi:TPA: DMT family transporter [Klebsiella quasipneumoniae]|uniref:DMT family transporter n=1 Tax=Klebsiella quasipneumoniae TaxID=1463165 RepID=UPI001ABC9D2B|nr:DMT family transporter [Klebsiella quasipneumoniae]MBO3686371.1 DMT family transporter [Klebsiella quasipneumoniae subsp. similipneumoniae]HBW1627644.1 DMT family transporter [Klebsiella quasipneumoniae subsp. similipneumoniae]HBW1660979.1 DMT family transporter [Klebsiella quasipneumoniae subsp. similipneumoniae]HBW1679421.1 DMT family transporter [Klebsiella quasipneumoniae subsp. similipneumoniae]HCM3834085.1 DMT family transporter [Klebsiella quasipneumoniae]